MRLALAVVCAIASATAAAFVTLSEKTIAARRTALRDFDVQAREVADALGELRAAQQAYVAVGQGTEFWLPKVDATKEAIGTGLSSLQPSAVSAESKAALEGAAAAVTEFGEVDRRIRGYLKTGAQLMAADIVFTEGGAAATTAARGVEKARIFDRVAFDSFESSRRRLELAGAGAAAALMLLTIVGFARRPPIVSVGEPASTEPATGDSRGLALSRAGDDELPLRLDSRHERTDERASSAERLKNATALKAVAELCTDIGRVKDLEQLHALLGRAAQLLDASGLVLWVASASGAELQPAMTHGYPPQTVARIPAVPYTADNAAAAAYRTGTLQVVPARPGSSVKGAIVAPIISVDGCIGVLSAELRGGGERSELVQALAAVLAAQLAGVVAATPAQDDGRASGGAAL